MKVNALQRFLSDYRWYVLGVVGIVAFVLGYIGDWQYFSQHDHRGPGVTDPLYATLKLIVLNGPTAPHPPVAMDVARFLVPAVAGWAGLAAMGLLFRDRMQQMRIPLMRGHVVLCGLGYVGSVFLRHLRDEHARVVVIESNATNPGIDLCRSLGVPVIVGDAQSQRVLQAAGVERAARLLAVCAEDAVNTEIIATAHKLVSEDSRSRLRCLARIGDPDLCSMLRIEQNRRRDGATTVDFFNTDEISARLLLDEYPIRAQNQKPHILIGHLDVLGSWVVWHAARDWYADRAAGDGTPLLVTVVDDDAERRIRALLGRHPELDQVCSFISASASVSDMRRLPSYHSEAAAPPVTRAYVTAYHDEKALETALKLRHELYASVPLVVALSRSHGVTRLIRNAVSDSGLNIEVFATLERTCTVELIRGGSFETIAHAIHRRWRVEQIRAGQPAPAWAELDDSRKESNREHALDIIAKLHAIGCEVAPLRDWDASDFELTSKEIETLAISEHDRWWDERLADGWKLGPKDVDRKKSPYLVPWQDLPPEIADLDRILVRTIPATLASAGLQVIRLRADQAGSTGSRHTMPR